MKTLKSVVLFAVMACLSLSSAAQETWRQQVQAELDDVEVKMTVLGFESTHEYKIGTLAADGTATISVTLDKGTQYRIVAVCDDDCGDVDIQVVDENDNEVDADREDDARPVASVTPRWTGRFEIRVTIPDCTVEPCYYGVAVFGK